MRNKLQIILILFSCLVGVWTINSCKKDKVASEVDQQLYEMSKTTTGFVWYKSSDSLLGKSPGSGHAEPFLRTRYNSIAATQLDTNGKVQANAVFPEGSLIVKELHSSSTTLGRYAILYKKSGSEAADAKGWVWGYIDADGTVNQPASKKGSACISCHSQAENINYMLMNKYFQ